MTCNYPNCRLPAKYIPVIELPTVRTLAVVKPRLSALINRPGALRLSGFAKEQVIRQYEASMKAYQRDVDTLAKTDKTTYMILREVCNIHRNSYNLFDWFRVSDWKLIREAGRENGYEIPPPDLVVIKFMPVGWLPGSDRLELER